jgi:hypothetical protein
LVVDAAPADAEESCLLRQPKIVSTVDHRLEFEQLVNDPVNKPNLNFWFGRPSWTRYQAAALILGIDPEKVPAFQDDVMCGNPPPKWTKDFFELCTRFKQAVAVQTLPEHFTPRQALEFIEANGYLPVPDYIKAYLASIERPAARRSGDVRSTASTKELNSTLKIIAGLIEVCYGTNLEPKQRGKLISEILGDLERVGQNMDRETLKKFVDKALDQFASASTPPNSA